MHVESAYPQSLVPRLTQHLVRRHDIQPTIPPMRPPSAGAAAIAFWLCGGSSLRPSGVWP
jgi:hypothetical protein